MLTNKEEKIVMSQDEDQVFGDNDHVARINLEEREKDTPQENGPARRKRKLMNMLRGIRTKLNRHKNEVRDYCRDARQTPMA